MCEMCVCGVRNDHGLDGGYRVLHRRGWTQEGALWVGAWAEPEWVCCVHTLWVRGCVGACTGGVRGWCADGVQVGARVPRWVSAPGAGVFVSVCLRLQTPRVQHRR